MLSQNSELELLLWEVAPVGSVIKEKTSLPASPPGGGTPHQMDDLGDRGQCFSCGLFGHGVNRCPQLDRSFPCKMPGWSVDIRNEQYRTSRMRGDEQDLRRGKKGWFWREGQPPGPSITETYLTQAGVITRLGNDRRMTLMDPKRTWFPSLRLKKIVAILRSRIVRQSWLNRMRTWTRSGA